MTKNKGFTLIELMVVILIVAILAAVLAPMMTGRIREAKWTEGKAGAGTIATALRAYCAEHETDLSTTPTFAELGILTADLQGKYFASTNYAISNFAYTAATGALTYTITVTPPTAVGGSNKTLTHAGVWSDVAAPVTP